MYPIYPYLGYKEKVRKVPIAFPPQHQDTHPGLESFMSPRPISENPHYQPADRLAGKVAIISGGDSGIGRAVGIAYAKEGADVVIAYLNEDTDAEETANRIQQLGKRCLLAPGDLGNEGLSGQIVNRTLAEFGRIDVLVNNCAVQYVSQSLMDIDAAQLERTFRTNIFSYFYLTKACLPHMQPGSAIINTASVTAYEGEETLIDYSSTKGAVVTFTRSLALSLVKHGIRVNAVAPGPIWTPLIPSSFSAKRVSEFGTNTPMGRAGQPFELAPAYVYLATDDSGYVSGQVIHVNGGVSTES